MPRAEYLLATDDALIAQSEVDRYRASGPGGQHRNKTESAVRLRHKPSGTTAIGEDSRSQSENKRSNSSPIAAQYAPVNFVFAPSGAVPAATNAARRADG